MTQTKKISKTNKVSEVKRVYVLVEAAEVNNIQGFYSRLEMTEEVAKNANDGFKKYCEANPEMGNKNLVWVLHPNY